MIVLWKPLYYVSIILFAVSALLFPLDSTWSIIVILALVTIWSRIPGFVHFSLNKLALNDFFAFIIAAHAGWFIGGLFGVFGILGARIFGPNEWWPYSLRASIAVFVASAFTPLIVSFTGGFNVIGMYWFEIVLYVTYYALVVMFYRDEIPLEMALLPGVFFFDFFMNAALITMFGNTISDMLSYGLSSGWPFIVFSGIILAFIIIARNGKKIGTFVQGIISGKTKPKGKEKIILNYNPAIGLKEERVYED